MKSLVTSMSLVVLLFTATVTKSHSAEKPAVKVETVVGYVSDIRETGKNESLFWNVKEGNNAVTLTTDKNDDQISIVCIWDGAPSIRIKVGSKVSIVGTYYGRTTGGAKVYTGCKLKE